VLAHLIDASDASGRPDPIADYNVIMGELESFGADLEKKPTVLVASKIDVANPEKIAKLRKLAKKLKLDLYEISAVTGKGIPELKYALGKRVAQIRAGTYEHAAPKARKAAAPRRAKKKAVGVKRIPKRTAFKKRRSR
jgi:GTP-binding protein